MSELSVTPNPWFALYVKNRHEKRIASSLEGKGIEAFLPTYPKVHEHSKKFDVPLFPGYVFCRLPIGDKLPVVSTPGVFLIVGNGSKAAIVPETEIEGIRRTVESGCMMKPWPYVRRGERISLRSGPLRGVEGVVVDETHDEWLVLSVHILQRSLAVKVDRSCLA